MQQMFVANPALYTSATAIIPLPELAQDPNLEACVTNLNPNPGPTGEFRVNSYITDNQSGSKVGMDAN